MQMTSVIADTADTRGDIRHDRHQFDMSPYTAGRAGKWHKRHIRWSETQHLGSLSSPMLSPNHIIAFKTKAWRKPKWKPRTEPRQGSSFHHQIVIWICFWFYLSKVKCSDIIVLGVDCTAFPQRNVVQSKRILWMLCILNLAFYASSD